MSKYASGSPVPCPARPENEDPAAIQTRDTATAAAGTSVNLVRPPDPISWLNVIGLLSMHLAAIAAVIYIAAGRSSWYTIALGASWYWICGLSVTAGYHRLFAHRSFEASSWVRAVLLFFGAASLQNSALAWSADHRRHHRQTDGPDDPYGIARGFWWAHIGWILRKSPPITSPPADLAADRLVGLQRRFYLPVALCAGFALPALIAASWNDALGGLLVAGFLRVVLQWHATFSINSFAHLIGRRPYSATTSARDSFWMAFFTFGEGFHNFHHRFQSDYRNGIRWFHFDPTKWLVAALSWVRATRSLRRVPAAVVIRVRSSIRPD